MAGADYADEEVKSRRSSMFVLLSVLSAVKSSDFAFVSCDSAVLLRP